MAGPLGEMFDHGAFFLFLSYPSWLTLPTCRLRRVKYDSKLVVPGSVFHVSHGVVGGHSSLLCAQSGQIMVDHCLPYCNSCQLLPYNLGRIPHRYAPSFLLPIRYSVDIRPAIPRCLLWPCRGHNHDYPHLRFHWHIRTRLLGSASGRFLPFFIPSPAQSSCSVPRHTPPRPSAQRRLHDSRSIRPRLQHHYFIPQRSQIPACRRFAPQRNARICPPSTSTSSPFPLPDICPPPLALPICIGFVLPPSFPALPPLYLRLGSPVRAPSRQNDLESRNQDAFPYVG